MKKILSTILVGGMLLSMGVVAFASEKEETITVGYFPNYGIIDEASIKGSEGYGYEYLEKIEENTDYKFEFVEVGWAEGARMLQDGEIDLFGPSAITEERRERVEFIEVPFCNETTCIYASEDTELYYKDPKGLNGLTLGIYKGDMRRERVEQYIKDHNIDLTVKDVDTIDFTKYIESGEIDVFIADSLFKQEGVKIIEEIYREPLYLATSKGNNQLDYALEQAMTKIEDENPYYNELLWEKYYSKVKKANQYLSKKEEMAIKEKDTYTVGYHVDMHPVTYNTGDSSEPRGYAIDTMNLIAEKLGIKITYVPLHDANNNSPEDVDFNLCIINDYCASCGKLSEAYSYQDLRVVMNAAHSEQEIENLVMLDYATVTVDKFLESYHPANLHKAYSVAELQDAYSKFDIDGTIALKGLTELIVNNNPTRHYKIDFLGLSVPMGVLVSNDLPKEVYTAMNKTILSLDEDVIEEFITTNISNFPFEITLSEFLEQNIFEIVVALLCMAMGIAVLYLYLTRRNKKRIQKILEVDSLTGIPTKYKFIQDVREILKTANSKHSYAIITIDIDNFKNFNKMHNDQFGDKILCEIAEILQESFVENAVICRLQNDEFAIFVAQTIGESSSFATQNEYNYAQSRRFKQKIDEYLKKLNVYTQINFSVGAYKIEDFDESVESMIDCANIARSYGKSTYGDTSFVFTKELKERQDKQNAITYSMENALVNEEFYIVIQPKVELVSGRLVGGEVLVRWQKADGTVVYPNDFIPLFEQNNFIVRLDKYIFEKTCQMIQNAKFSLPVISINVSVASALEDDLLKEYLKIANQYGVLPSQIELELTETVIDAEFDRISRFATDLKIYGFTLAIDDFGKGASSLTRIKTLDVDVVKIDQAFIDDNMEDEKGIIVLQRMISMANELGFVTLAEGIETTHQKDVLTNLDCDLGQGYLFDKPLSVDEFLKRVDENEQKEFPPLLKKDKRLSRYWSNFENLTYGVAVAANDPYSTVIKANDAFYAMIGHSKENFQNVCLNRLTEILVDNLYTLVKKNLDEKLYRFDFNLRILNEHNEIVWVHDIVEFDPDNNLFYITFVDITNKMNPVDIALTLESHNVEKEISVYLSKHTPNYIYVSDVITQELLYYNDNCMRFLNAYDDTDWKKKKFYELIYGTANPVNLCGEIQQDENSFSRQEYYNENQKMFLSVQSKNIMVYGKEVCLHIATDITANHKIENELSLQSTLNDCMDALENLKTTHLAFEHMLINVREYYDADCAYYFELFDQKDTMKNIFEVLTNNGKSQRENLKNLSEEEQETLLNAFKSVDEFYFPVENLLKSNISQNIKNIFIDAGVRTVLFALIKDTKNELIGFLGVGNPKRNKLNTELMKLLSRFIWISISNNNVKMLERSSLLSEEESKLQLLNTCSAALRTLSSTPETMNEVLTLLRKHYEASSGVIIMISADRQSFSVTYESHDANTHARFAYSQNHPIEMINRLIQCFANNTSNSIVFTIQDLRLPDEEKAYWEEQGLANAYIAPIHDENNVVGGILLLENPLIFERSLAIIQVVVNFIVDYNAKLMLKERDNEKLEQSLLEE